MNQPSSVLSSEIVKTRLSNGMLVLLKEIHTAPIISQWIWYQVGSRNETPGMTGISHWVEHMLFKGTPQFPSTELDKAISREGGYWNALTHLDWTTYFETMPADKIDLATRLEADRMVNGLFESAEVSAERTVIISERQGNENDPMFRLMEAVQATAFQVHSYHHEVIGDLADLQTIQREDLYQHYRTFYVPNNAVMTVAGDFDTPQMLARIRELFEPLPPGPEVTWQPKPEPDQSSERLVTVEGPGETIYLLIAYRIPKATHPDFFPLMVLDSLLTGPSSINVFGGGITNNTSRLYQALVEKELAVSVSGGVQATIDPYLYLVTIIVHSDRSVEEVMQAFEAEVNKLQDSMPPTDDLVRAVKQARALFAYGSESITNQAFWMGFAEMFASYDWFTRYLDKLTCVTPEEVQRAAQTYLRTQNRVLGVHVPTNGAGSHQAGDAL